MHSAAKAAILKLCRIIMSHGERYVDKLRCNDIEGVLRSGIYLQENSITVSIASDCIAGDDPICSFDFFFYFSFRHMWSRSILKHVVARKSTFASLKIMIITSECYTVEIIQMVDLVFYSPFYFQ